MHTKCSTLAGWNAHQRNGEPQCAGCLKAKAEYMKEWRRRTGRTKRMLVPVTERNNP